MGYGWPELLLIRKVAKRGTGQHTMVPHTMSCFSPQFSQLPTISSPLPLVPPCRGSSAHVWQANLVIKMEVHERYQTGGLAHGMYLSQDASVGPCRVDARRTLAPRAGAAQVLLHLSPLHLVSSTMFFIQGALAGRKIACAFCTLICRCLADVSYVPGGADVL